MLERFIVNMEINKWSEKCCGILAKENKNATTSPQSTFIGCQINKAMCAVSQLLSNSLSKKDLIT